ncbi:hypothetical protein GCM10009760_38040 [Kitasatospora kazusensis]|uniref:Peptidase inhibitor family I36 n=1 Tax=Kitasatospora kazusensis TaxID=407974 RepID=A0ABN2ZTL9_9ACTN
MSILTRVRASLVALGVAASSLTIATVGATAAHAATMAPAYNNCGESGVYYCQEVDSSIGSIRLATALGSDHHEYAQAEGFTSAASHAVYMDQSSDNGRTWTGWINPLYNQDGGWTDPIYDGPPYVTRACLTDQGQYICTAWH